MKAPNREEGDPKGKWRVTPDPIRDANLNLQIDRRCLRKNLTVQQQPRDALLDGSGHWLPDGRERHDSLERNEGFFLKKICC